MNEVADFLKVTFVDDRCPKCSAALRADAQWCSLCHEDLRPPEVIAAAKARAEAATTPADAPAIAGRGKHAKRRHASSTTATIGAEFGTEVPSENWEIPELVLDAEALAPEGQLTMFGGAPASKAGQLTDEEIALLRSLDQSPDLLLGQWSSKLDSPSAKFGIVIGGMVVFTIAGLALLTLVGLFIH